MNDEEYCKYGSYSEIMICYALLGNNVSPSMTYNYAPPQLDLEPPPRFLSIFITKVQPYKCNHYKSMPTGTPFISNINAEKTSIPLDIFHLLWRSYIFPSFNLINNTITPSIILTLLANNDTSRFNTPINKNFISLHYFQIQLDRGVNHSVTNSRDYIHTYWDINSYSIDSIEEGIFCTEKFIFHLVCDDRCIMSITMFFSADATNTVVSPTDVTPGGSLQIAQQGKSTLGSIKLMKSSLSPCHL